MYPAPLPFFDDSSTKLLRLALNRNLPVLASRVAGVTGLCHKALPCMDFCCWSVGVSAMQRLGLGFSAAQGRAEKVQSQEGHSAAFQQAFPKLI